METLFKIGLLVLVGIISLTSCKKEEPIPSGVTYVPESLLAITDFEEGTYWVYRDNLWQGRRDSFVVCGVTMDYDHLGYELYDQYKLISVNRFELDTTTQLYEFAENVHDAIKVTYRGINVSMFRYQINSNTSLIWSEYLQSEYADSIGGNYYPNIKEYQRVKNNYIGPSVTDTTLFADNVGVLQLNYWSFEGFGNFTLENYFIVN